MTIRDITIKEYQCGHCGYKWTNYNFTNETQGPIPKNCAKCKRLNWNDPTERITPYEQGLRRKIKQFFNIYEWEYYYLDKDKVDICFPYDLSQKFLDIRPRPTIEELNKVLKPYGYDLRVRHNRYVVPDPDRPGGLKRISPYIQDPKRPDQRYYDTNNAWLQLKFQEMQKRQELMIEIMKSRGVEYDAEMRLKVQREKRREEYEKKHKEWSTPEKQNEINDIFPDKYKKMVGDGICNKCKRRKIIIPNDDNVLVCEKCGTELSDKWTSVVMLEKEVLEKRKQFLSKTNSVT